MATEVIMPALGMAQETGKLLSWLKAPGDAVQTGDVLFEVETDKSVSEVEAPVDGYLTDVTASPGEDVPVPTTAPLTGRVLASPKAKRLATEEGLDLIKLQQAGHSQPYHVSDLAILRNLPSGAPTAVVPQIASHQIASHQITAQVPVAGLVAFLDRMSSEGGVMLPASAVLCNFTAAAWRSVIDEGSLVLGLVRIGQPDSHLIDPDRFRLSAQPDDTSQMPVALILRDLSGSAITSMQIGAATAPLINVASDGATYTLNFTFTTDQMTDDAAIAFVTDLAARVSDPLPYLV